MNWQKITIWIINILFYLTILSTVLGVFLAIFATEWFTDRKITIDSPKLIIDESLRYPGSDSINITPRVESIPNVDFQISHATVSTDVKTFLKTTDAWDWVYGVITGLTEIVLYLYALWLLRAIVKSANNPFIFENVKRLRILGLILIVSSIFQKINGWYLSWSIRNEYQFSGVELEDSQDFNWILLLAGLFVMIIAQVFDHGLKLKAEQDLTI